MGSVLKAASDRFNKDVKEEMVKNRVRFTVTDVKEEHVKIDNKPVDRFVLKVKINLADSGLKRVKTLLPRDGVATLAFDMGYTRDESIQYIKANLPLEDAFMFRETGNYIGLDNDDEIDMTIPPDETE